MKEVKQLARERSIRVNQSVEKRWKESEEKVKVFERTRKASFNKARQLSKKVSVSKLMIILMLSIFYSYLILTSVSCWMVFQRRGRRLWSRS